MTNLHIHHTRLTPQMRSVLERMARAGHPPLHTRTPQEARIAYQAGADVLYILTGQRAAGALAPDEAALLDNYRHTPPERRHTVQEVSSAFAQYDEAVKKARAAGGGG